MADSIVGRLNPQGQLTSVFYGATYGTRPKLNGKNKSILVNQQVLSYKGVMPSSENSSRWSEYLFLFNGCLIAVAFAVIVDMVGVFVCPEYFIRGKGLSEENLLLETVKLAIRASYWVGLIAALLMLVAGRFGTSRQVKIKYLYRLWYWPICLAFATAIVSGVHHRIYFEWWLGHERHLLESPKMFATVWGIAKGSYIGAALGLGVSLLRVAIQRIASD